MTPLDSFDRFAAKAREEAVPPLDVSGGMLRRVRALPPERENHRFLAVFSAVAALAAAVMALVALDACDALTDPLAGVLDTLTLVMR